MTITVYTKPACPACKLTKKQLEKCELPYCEQPMTDEIREAAVARGELSAPIVQAGDQLWGGFRPDRIRALVGA